MNLHKLILMLVICIPYFSNARSFYSKFIPDDILMQFAGNQGMLSVGFGYSYEISKRNRTTAFMYGYLPEHIAGTDIHIVCLKQGTEIFNFEIEEYFISSSINLTTIMSLTDNTFITWPDHYPQGYYPSNAFHIQPSISFSTKLNSDSHSELCNVLIYSEIGILDQRLYHIIKTGRVKILDSINLSLGFKYNFNSEIPENIGRE
ncbi:MAG: hypothetical protein WC212_10145 [Candidatus Delongbacteria bacterium]